METRNRRCRRIRSNYSFGADPQMFTQAILSRQTPPGKLPLAALS